MKANHTTRNFFLLIGVIGLLFDFETVYAQSVIENLSLPGAPANAAASVYILPNNYCYLLITNL